jgi:hypothetical protein
MLPSAAEYGMAFGGAAERRTCLGHPVHAGDTGSVRLQSESITPQATAGTQHHAWPAPCGALMQCCASPINVGAACG